MNLNIIITAIVWIIYTLVLLPLYIVKEKKLGLVKAVKFKLALSTVFCIVGLISVFRQNTSIFSVLIFMGLISSMIGDYYLIYIKDNEQKFIKGIVYFGIAHLFYIISMFTVVGIGFLEFITTALMMVFLALSTRITKPQMGKATVPIACYSVLVGFMAIKATLMLFSGDSGLTLQLIFSGGALLFMISDLFLVIWRFIMPKPIFSRVVAICYFIGQLMIATSVYFQS